MSTKLTFNELTRTANNNAPKINSSLLLTTSTTSNSTFQHTTTKLNNLSIDTTNVIDSDEREKKTIAEFVHLLDKSKQLFNGLRDLPQYGHSSNQWQAYFGRTFDVYTKLWKYQQQHRQVLDLKYNLKRWQIGEIASKIGQLYYHYYLRTSESNYLNESYSFYQAIQTRSYYSKANKEDKPDLMVKKLRYYARFIVVCLLLKKTKQVRELIKELSKQIEEYVRIYDPEDQLEWQMVRNEINDFIESDTIVSFDNPNVNNSNTSNLNNNLIISNRLTVSQVPHLMFDRLNLNLVLQELIIVGNRHDQIKFSELSLDMFRMLQAVERELSPPVANNEKIYNTDSDKKDDTPSQTIIHRDNPHKYLLYKPSFSQFLTYISASFKDLAPHGVLMVYISADNCEPHKTTNDYDAYESGGVRTNSKKEIGNVFPNSNINTSGNHGSASNYIDLKKSSLHYHTKETHCIYPGDLYPFLRKPLFLIVDSSNSHVFKSFPNLFNQPFLALLSPTHTPGLFSEHNTNKGSIFTLFLTNPLLAFCFISSKSHLSVDLWTKCQAQIRLIFSEIAKLFSRSKQIDVVFIQFCSDDFLRVFLYRFVFCLLVLKLNRNFKGSDYYPSSQPKLANDIAENTQLHDYILELSNMLDVRHLYLDGPED